MTINEKSWENWNMSTSMTDDPFIDIRCLYRYIYHISSPKLNFLQCSHMGTLGGIGFKVIMRNFAVYYFQGLYHRIGSRESRESRVTK